MSPIPRDLPLVHEFPEWLDIGEALRRLANRPYCLLLESSMWHPQLGRYSFLVADPPEVVRVPVRARTARRSSEVAVPDELQPVRARWSDWRTPALPKLPPFQGGIAGLIAYEWNHHLEFLPLAPCDEFRMPAVVLGWYDVVIAWDHAQKKTWLISQGIPETEHGRRVRRGAERMAEVLDWLRAPLPESPDANVSAIAVATPHCPTPFPGVFSNFTADGFEAAVEIARDRIRAGEIFQVNLAQRLMQQAEGSALDAYLRLRQRAPATFAAYFDLQSHQLVSISPERFLKVEHGHVEARPIKGTRQTMRSAEANLFLQSDLADSRKDAAENIMIVDLLRNDLSRVCRDDSIGTPQLLGVESYGYVHHLVSVVTGMLDDGRDGIDLLAAAFPCGSVTGAPKVRAMEIITELEGVARGAYCGSLGYLGLDGRLDWNVLIRTMTFAGGWCQMPVGGGIVIQSDPRQEYLETWHKAAGMMKGRAAGGAG